MFSKRVLVLFLMLAFAAAGLAAFAQEAPKPAETPRAEDKPVVVGARLYLWYSQDIANKSATLPREPKTDHFTLNRAYIMVGKEFTDVFSARLVTDVNSAGNSSSNQQYIYIKHAFIQMRLGKDSPVPWTTRLGADDTPINGLQYSLSDTRWIYNNYIERAGDVLNGVTIDHSADVGLFSELNLFKIVRLNAAYCNGEGFTARLTETNQDKSKRLYGMLTLTPLKQLYISGFYKTDFSLSSTALTANPPNTTYLFNDQSTLSYWGAMIAWSDKTFKIGASYAVPYRSTIAYYLATGAQVGIYGLRSRMYGRILDTWAHINLAELTGLGFIFYGRYALGIEDQRTRTSANWDRPNIDTRTRIWTAGVGYQLNRNVRILGMYEVIDTKGDTRTVVSPSGEAFNRTENIPMERTFWVKAEANFI